jgi:mannose-6-phosphate isomerase-like protein (cupin superfamily)
MAVGAVPRTGAGQTPLAPATPSGQTATPAFEGWYKNPDGTFSLSFGYYNRNLTEVLSVPLGPDNFISPGDANQGQPTFLYPRRHWGVFAVKVPADFGDKKVVWTLKVRGKTFAISGSLREEWQIDALEGEAGSNNTPPVLALVEGGPQARGPGGSTVDRTATVGKPITINVVATDDGASLARTASPVTLTWFTHQGPAQVTFGTPTVKLTPQGGSSSTTATFSKPGDYIIRVRATDSEMVAAGHSQCCWTNAFVKVRVTP